MEQTQYISNESDDPNSNKFTLVLHMVSSFVTGALSAYVYSTMYN